MKCPYCEREMIPGFIQSGREVFFTRKIHRWLFAPDGDDVTLTRDNMTKPNCVACHCPGCKKVIVDYGS